MKVSDCVDANVVSSNANHMIKFSLTLNCKCEISKEEKNVVLKISLLIDENIEIKNMPNRIKYI